MQIYILNSIAITCLFIATAILIIHFQSKNTNEPKSRLTTKEEIDSLFDTIDPINQELPQGLFDTQNVH